MNLRSLVQWVFILNIMDVASDFLYLRTQEFASPMLLKIAWCIFVVDTLGFFLLTSLAFCLNEAMHVYVLCDKDFDLRRIWTEWKDTLKVGLWMSTMTVLDHDIPKKEAVYRTGVLVHTFLHSFPMLVLQSINNSMTFSWFLLSSASCMISFAMIVLGGFVSYHTKQHLL
mmetsp:Transcript_28084/g.50300  ORF Transcript_28084/g.50300 Transcript_28084/m.50300 type:complete len:170 (-) Transcript_28084:41-550(-)